jgi:hypothetical protein
MNKKHLEYWETLCPNADTEIDNYIRLLLKGEKTIKQVFQRIKEIELDTENFDADICKETINKVFYFVVENTDISGLDIAEAYHQVEEENEEENEDNENL